MIDGLDGIEVFYPDHAESFREYLLNTCKQNELLVSGGSDDHLAPKDGPQYKMGSISIEDIPETKWIKDHLQSGTDFIEKQKSELLEVLHSKKEKSLEQNSKTIQMEEGRENDE